MNAWRRTQWHVESVNGWHDEKRDGIRYIAQLKKKPSYISETDHHHPSHDGDALRNVRRPLRPVP